MFLNSKLSFSYLFIYYLNYHNLLVFVLYVISVLTICIYHHYKPTEDMVFEDGRLYIVHNYMPSFLVPQKLLLTTVDIDCIEYWNFHPVHLLFYGVGRPHDGLDI